jgi:hypothetical protein
MLLLRTSDVNLVLTALLFFNGAMKRRVLIAFVVIGAVVLWAGLRRVVPSSIEYRGEKIKLTRFYLDYDEYKNDPDNIDPSETARVQRLVSEAPIAHSFRSRQQAVAAVFEIKFPGYGAGGFGDGGKHDSITGFSVEVPRSNMDRYFVFRDNGGTYELIDDFVDSSMPGINHVEEQRGNLVYSMDGKDRKLVRPPQNK